jgi:uncharacterized RDD family membrane protein YckC
MIARLDTDVAIETPEHIVFHYRTAGPARRALAQMVDLAVCYGALALLAVCVVLVSAGPAGVVEGATAAAKLGMGILLLALFAAQWIYFAAFESALGRTPGKMALGLRVVTTTGRPIGLFVGVLRNLLRAADILPVGYVAGVVAMALTARFQRMGDLVAGTMVVAPEANRPRAAAPLNPPPEARELEGLPDEVALDADERAAIELFLRRRNTLGHARARELAEMIAPQIGARLGFAHSDPVRLLAIVYDRAVNARRAERRADATDRRSWR